MYIMVSFKVSADTSAQTYVLTAEISTKNFFNFLRKFCTHKKLFGAIFLVTKCINIYINYLESMQSQYKYLHPRKAQLDMMDSAVCFEVIRKFCSDCQTDNEKLSSSDMI